MADPMTPPPLRVRAQVGDEWKSFTFDKPFRIGRTEECEVCIKNEHVSRKHVEVLVENGAWLVRDLNSANGIFLNGERVASIPVRMALQMRLGIYGPFVELELAPQATPVVKVVEKAATHYFGNPEDLSVGEHTRMVRRAYAEVQVKQKRTYGGIIAALVVCVIAAGAYAYYLHLDAKKNRERAEAMFYGIKSIDVSIADFERKYAASGNSDAAAEAARLRSQRKSLDEGYQRMLVSLKVFDPKMTEEQKLVLQVARIFGECELDMPKNFYDEVHKYIGYWKSTDKYRKAIRLAQAKGYTKPIADEFLSQNLPPQFFYLGLQESSFDEHAVGPITYMGYAKGMWQFIPQTAGDYGLKVGPLVATSQVDVGDDRHHWDRETKAAASYIKFLYSTDAQASGLLVMACYNWGEGSVLKLVKSMPNNPRERNFWKLLQLYHDKIPDQTYQYVFSIVSAAVIGENPRLFGMDFDNPLQGK